MAEKKLTRNQRYEAAKRAEGLAKRTFWIPENLIVEFNAMAEFCRNNPDHIPYMARSLTTGRMAKIEN